MTVNSKIWPEELNLMWITLNQKSLTNTMVFIRTKKCRFRQILIITFVSMIKPRELPPDAAWIRATLILLTWKLSYVGYCQKIYWKERVYLSPGRTQWTTYNSYDTSRTHIRHYPRCNNSIKPPKVKTLSFTPWYLYLQFEFVAVLKKNSSGKKSSKFICELFQGSTSSWQFVCCSQNHH